VREIPGDQLQFVRQGDRRDHRIDASDGHAGALKRTVHSSREYGRLGGERQHLHPLNLREKAVDLGLSMQAFKSFDDLHDTQDRDRELPMLRQVRLCLPSNHLVLAAKHLGQDVRVEESFSHLGASTDRARARPLRLR